MNPRVATVIREMQEHCRPLNITEDDFYDQCCEPIPQLPFKISCDQGISKGVFLIEGADEVIKVPFSGYYDEDAYSEAMFDYEAQQEALDRGEEIDETELLTCPEYEDYFTEFCCAATPSIDTFEMWNYCALECAIYLEAEKEGLEEYFAREYKAGDMDGYPIYVQARAIMIDSDEGSSYRSHSKAQIESARKTREETQSPIYETDWIAEFIDCYGAEEFARLNKFLHKHRLTDFHSGNLGYINGIPVLVDYSSYKE